MAEENINIKRDRFVRIAESRTTVILNGLESLGKCANKRNYEYYEKDITEIFGEINKKLREVRALFQEGQKRKNRFRLSRGSQGNEQ